MKKIFLHLLCVFVLTTGCARNGFTQSKLIDVDELVPDIPLGDIYMPESTIESLYELNGKLIILDFWNTWCSSCIAAFPKLNTLQAKFGDSIQILLVNSTESRQQIAERFDKLGIQETDFPNLTFVASAHELGNVFPHRAVPHHVWIDEERRVKLIGASLNTHAKKIEDLLSGRSVHILKNSNTSKPWQSEIMLHHLIGAPINSPSELFANHINDYGPLSSVSFEGVYLETVDGIRDSYFNTEVAAMYYEVFAEVISQQQANIIYAGKYSAGSSNYWLDYCDIQYEDTLKLTSGHVPAANLTDEHFVNNRYCYEQILPKSTSAEERKEHMLNRLNIYFGKHLNLHGHLIEKDVLAYVLTSRKQDPENKIIRNSVNTPLKNKLQYPVYHLFMREKEMLPFVIDQTGLKEEDVENLPVRYDSFEELEDLLGKIGVNISLETITLKFVSLRMS